MSAAHWRSGSRSTNYPIVNDRPGPTRILHENAPKLAYGIDSVGGMNRFDSDTLDFAHSAERRIIHVDMDAFYAAVEQRDAVELRGRPVIVGGAPHRRGVVAAASYEAREFGVHSAMPTAAAVRLCPGAIRIAPRFAHYATVSQQIRSIFGRYTPIVEPLSLDEAFLDVSASQRLWGDAINIAQRIKNDIVRELGLVASVGIATNKFVAKIASDIDKPDGFVEVEMDKITEFLNPLPVTRIWGIGKVAAKRLADLGIITVHDLKRIPNERLIAAFGASGHHWLQLARGIDSREVVADHAVKSLSHEVTFAEDLDNDDELRATLTSLVENAAARLRAAELRASTVQLKIRHYDFTTRSRSRSFAAPTRSTAKFLSTAVGLLTTYRQQYRGAVRLVGVGLSGCGGAPTQSDLFTESVALDTVTDSINQRFGDRTLRRAAGLNNKS